MDKILENIEALTFDVGGTVFDWQTAVRTQVSTIDSTRNADVVQLASLEDVSHKYPSLQLTDEEKSALVEVWHSMNVWDDFPG